MSRNRSLLSLKCLTAPRSTSRNTSRISSSEHKYSVLEQSEISDPDHCLAEDHLWAFLNDTQKETIDKLAEDYGADARDEIFRALKDELRHTPLWLIIRNGLKVRGLEFKLYYPKARSSESIANEFYAKNRITFRPHFYFGETNTEIDFVFFLNGLPISALELKHEKNQNVHDAIAQYSNRDHSRQVFQLPFLFIAADTCDVMVATDPRREQNFPWFNTGLINEPITTGEYPVEFLYREVLSKDRILEALSFFLIFVQKQEAYEDRSEQAAFTIFPRYHQSRMVRKVADEALAHFIRTGEIGRKYLINHSAGSDKTLSICWLADRLHSLYKPDTNDKLVNMVVIFLTCFCTYAKEIQEFAAFAEYVGPQLIKQGTVSELMKQVRQTDVVKAAVQYQGEVRSGGPIKLKPSKGRMAAGPPQKKVSIRDMIDEIRQQFDITDEQALYIREVTDEKIKDPTVQATVTAHKEDLVYLEDVYSGHVNQEIQMAYANRDRYDELTDPKYIDAGAIFDIMAFTVIGHNLRQAKSPNE